MRKTLSLFCAKLLPRFEICGPGHSVPMANEYPGPDEYVRRHQRISRWKLIGLAVAICALGLGLAGYVLLDLNLNAGWGLHQR